MKKLFTLFILTLLPMLASAQTALDVQNSGCLSKTRGEEAQMEPTIILTKEGSTLSVQLLNYESNCATQDFNVSSSINGEGGIYGVSVDINPVLPELVTSCLCPFNISFTIHDMEPNCFYLNCWWYSGNVELTEGEPLVLDNNNPDTQDYFPEGTKWTEIRLDTLKYDSWYSKVGDEWVPNFETIEYYVKGEYTDNNGKKYKCVYTNGPEWTDSLTLLLQEEGDADYIGHDCIMVSVLIQDYDWNDNLINRALFSGEAYQFDWSIGKGIYFKDILMSNTTSILQSYYYGMIDEIKEGNFGGVRPLKYVDLDGKAPDNNPNSPIRNISTQGGRILQGIGITEWNDGECLFGPPNPYSALRMFDSYPEEKYPQRHYRSMLVHFERNGEVLYNVWPEVLPQDDYIPLVKEGKRWNVLRSDFDSGCHLEQYIWMNEGLTEAASGKTYLTMYRSEDDKAEVWRVGIFREEDRKVYFFDDAMQKEYLMFDFSLQAGDTYETYSYDDQKMVSYKVLSVDNYTEGPEVIRYEYDEKGDSMVTHHRLLRKWTVRRMDNNLEKTWIEGAGSLEGPLGNLQDVVLPGLTKDYLAYVEYKGEPYLPFSFYDTMNKQIHGCNLPTGAEDYKENDEHHKLTYELEGNRLHIYGKVFTQCGPNNYAYFYEKKTDDPLVNKIEFVIQEVEPLADCMALHATNFYVPGFDPNMNYIVVDNQGVEHPVINKTPQMAYRPMIEEGKVWKVGEILSNPVQLVEYYYFDGDTIIDGKTCKQMMCQRYVSREHPNYDYLAQRPSLSYVGAWYEEDKKVYTYDTISKQFTMMYDFSLGDNDTLVVNRNNQDYRFAIGPRQTGGLKGFKGVYREIWWCDEPGRHYSPTWLEGVGSIDSPTANFYYGYVDPSRFLMSCTVGDEVIYLNDSYEDAATPKEMGARKQRFDFTHTIKTKPKAPMRREGEMALYGEYSQQQLAIHLNPLDDAYLVRITDETGKDVYQKAINAGNIVGLNIDISAYEKGRYTVTVENSNESFTGEFEAQTTGIEAISYQPSAVRHHIYNLQGQRISTLQKGLNIVNGQKIYVK